MSAKHPPWVSYPDGVTTVDAEYVRPGFAAVHVLERGGRAAVIDTGANSSVPLVMRALAGLGVKPEAVDWLILTHVHLDHAGGAGRLLEQLPHARVAVHPRGAQHLVAPARLEAATKVVYGEETFARLYGKLLPVPAERLYETSDGERLTLGGHELSILHTPGHALHHQVLFDPAASALFAGDTFGLSYRELDTDAGAFVIATTTPSQFDPDQLSASVDRIVELDPKSLYLTHYGRVTGAARLGARLREQITRFVELAREHAASGDRYAKLRAALRHYLIECARRHGITEPAAKVDGMLGADLDLNAQGLVAWLERVEKRHRG